MVDPATGQVASEYIYDSFGNQTQTGSLTQRYGFTGREVDDENGLIYFRARHYDPNLGQFIQRDPIGFAGGDLNLYAYVWNDPLNWTDPSGLKAKAKARSGGSSTADWLLLTAAVATQCAATNCIAATHDALQDAFDNGFNSGLGAGSNGNPPPPVGGSGVVGAIAGGLGTLIGNAWADMQRMWDQYINESRKGGGPGPGPQTGSGDGAGAGTGTPPPPGGPNDDDGEGEKTKPSKNLEAGDRIDLGKFTQRVRGTKDFVDPKTGWRISPDKLGPNSHGGSAYKLFDPTGKIRFTLDAFGKVLRG